MSATENIDIARITVADRLRSIDMDSVERIAESIDEIGLRTPITVRASGKDLILVAGAHRLEAVKRLGKTKIEAFVVENWNEREARRWEIAENLHRADLTVLQRDEHRAEYIKITEELQSSQVATIESKRADGKGHRPESGVNAAARQIGVDKDAAHRSIKVAGLTAEAKKVAREEKLDNNQRALLAASRAAPDKQADVLRNWRKAETLPPRPLYRPDPVVAKNDPPDMYVVARQLAGKYSVIELAQLIDHLGDLIKEREAA